MNADGDAAARMPLPATTDAGRGARHPATSRRIRHTRLAAQSALVVLVWTWHVRSTGSVSITALALLAAVVAVSMIFGRTFQRCSIAVVDIDAGVAWQMLAGFFCANTLLFALTLASPFGLATNAAIVGAVAMLLHLLRGGPVPRPVRSLASETASLACIVVCGVAATLWVHQQQPVAKIVGDHTVFTAWTDLFIQSRLISEFAAAHGAATLADIKFAGGASPVYHFASYMVPAALDALAGTSAVDAYVAFLLPFGILLVGLAGYAFVAIVWRRPWSALIAAIAVTCAPDAFEQGFGIRILGFHFMSQVNLGMLYGIACIAIAWILMLEACRAAKLGGVVAAFAFLALCLTYKAHLFVANALVLMLYPCFFFAGLRWRRRAGFALAAVVLFATVVALSQLSSRVPTIRPDGSGAFEYLRILVGGFDPGWRRSLFDALYFAHRLPTAINAMLIGGLIAFASFGWWLPLAPLVLVPLRQALGRRTLWFIAIVVVNYLAMSLVLALDARGIGAREELLNRPMAWAYFVLVAFTAASVHALAYRSMPRAGRWLDGAFVVVAALSLAGVQRHAVDLQTAPGWPNLATYADFNAVPTCLVRSADWLRRVARPTDVIADSRFDPHFVLTALSERQLHAIDAAFAGESTGLAERIDAMRRMQARGNEQALRAYAAEQGIDWYVLHREDVAPWPETFLARADYRCDGLRVYRLAR